MSSLKWEREGYARWIEPETWILTAPLHDVYARIQLRDGFWVSLSHPEKGPWRQEEFEHATAALLSHCMEHGKPPGGGRIVATAPTPEATFNEQYGCLGWRAPGAPPRPKKPGSERNGD